MRVRRSPGLASVLRAAFLVALVVGPAEAGAQNADADPPELVSVTFEGNAAIDADLLAAAVVNRETSCRLVVCWWRLPRDPYYLNRRELPLDVWRLRVFYIQRGFRDVQVDTAVVDLGENTAELRFTIEEGRPTVVDSISFSGAEGIRVPHLYRDLPLTVGSRLSQIALAATRDSLTNRMRNNGFARAEVDLGHFIPAEDRYSARVFFEIYPGEVHQFGTVTVDGAAELTPTVVRRMLPFQEGDPYDRSKVIQGQQNLFGLDLVRHANFQELAPLDGGTVVPVQVEVSEGDVHRVRGGGGFSSAECFEAEARWASRNFQGGGRGLAITGRLSNILTKQFCDTFLPDVGTGAYGELNWLASIEFTQPYVGSSRNALTAALFAERTSIPNIFIRKAIGANIGLARTLDVGGILTPSYRPQLIQLEAAEVYFCAAYLVCDADEIQQLRDPNWLSPIGLNYRLDRQDQPLNPTTGYTISADYEYAGEWTLSDYSYNRISGAFATYGELSPGLVIAGRIRGGWLVPGDFRELISGETRTDIVHPEKRFFSGGSNSVRGFAQNELGPRNLSIGVSRLITAPGEDLTPVCTPESVIDLTCDANPLDDGAFDRPLPVGGTMVTEANLEARYQASELAQVVLFVDVGQVFEETGQFSFGELEWTPGTGLRLLTPIGPVRFDVAYNFRDSQYLPVVTEEIRPYEAGDDESRVVETPDGRLWYVTDGLSPLEPPVLYPTQNRIEPLPNWSWRRFQLHLTIGQAF